MLLVVQVNTVKRRYEVGLSKLANTETSVAAMQVRRVCQQNAWPIVQVSVCA